MWHWIKYLGFFAIWLLLFATFGPLAEVSAAVGSCEDAYEVTKTTKRNSVLCNERSEAIKAEDPSKPGCFWDKEGWDGCLTIPPTPADCSDCGGSAATCGKDECVGVYGASRIHNGYPGVVMMMVVIGVRVFLNVLKKRLPFHHKRV